jgi:hypothetical protein
LSIGDNECGVLYLRMNPWLVISSGTTQVVETTAEAREALRKILFDLPSTARRIDVGKPVERGRRTTVRENDNAVVVGNVSLRI